MNSGQVTKIVRREMDAAQVNKPGACHLFQHTLATLMLEGTADLRYVQAMLGHADVSTTQTYTRVAIAKLKEVYEQTHPAAKLARRKATGDGTTGDDTADPRAAFLDRLAAGELFVWVQSGGQEDDEGILLDPELDSQTTLLLAAAPTITPERRGTAAREDASTYHRAIVPAAHRFPALASGLAMALALGFASGSAATPSVPDVCANDFSGEGSPRVPDYCMPDFAPRCPGDVQRWPEWAERGAVGSPELESIRLRAEQPDHSPSISTGGSRSRSRK